MTDIEYFSPLQSKRSVQFDSISQPTLSIGKSAWLDFKSNSTLPNNPARTGTTLHQNWVWSQLERITPDLDQLWSLGAVRCSVDLYLSKPVEDDAT